MQLHTPVGYQVRNGKIEISEEKKELVLRIFHEYDSGTATLPIAEKLKQEGIKNANGKVSWTHISIGKILENNYYLGTEYYPQMIDKELFDRVQKKREQMRIDLGRGKHGPDEKYRILFGGKIVCACCNEPYRHYRNKSNSNLEAKWKCKNYIYQNRLECGGGFITDHEVMEVCRRAINLVIADKNILEKIEPSSPRINPKNVELDRRLKESIEEKKSNDDVLTLLYQRATEQYKTLVVQDSKIKADHIKEILKGKEILQEFNIPLYEAIIKQIRVNKDQTVHVIYQNGGSIQIGY